MRRKRGTDANKDIREAIYKRRLYHYEVAEQLGIREETFCRMLREELPQEKKNEILEAIKKIEL